MESIQWLLAANAAVWLGIGLYLFLLARSQQTLDRRIRRMEMLGNDNT